MLSGFLQIAEETQVDGSYQHTVRKVLLENHRVRHLAPQVCRAALGGGRGKGVGEGGERGRGGPETLTSSSFGFG